MTKLKVYLIAILIFLLGTVVIATSNVTSAVPSCPLIEEDVNNDNQVNVLDVQEVLNVIHVSNTKKCLINGQEYKTTDVNRDFDTTREDAKRVMQKIHGQQEANIFTLLKAI